MKNSPLANFSANFFEGSKPSWEVLPGSVSSIINKNYIFADRFDQSGPMVFDRSNLFQDHLRCSAKITQQRLLVAEAEVLDANKRAALRFGCKSSSKPQNKICFLTLNGVAIRKVVHTPIFLDSL